MSVDAVGSRPEMISTGWNSISAVLISSRLLRPPASVTAVASSNPASLTTSPSASRTFSGYKAKHCHTDTDLENSSKLCHWLTVTLWWMIPCSSRHCAALNSCLAKSTMFSSEAVGFWQRKSSKFCLTLQGSQIHSWNNLAMERWKWELGKQLFTVDRWVWLRCWRGRTVQPPVC